MTNSNFKFKAIDKIAGEIIESNDEYNFFQEIVIRLSDYRCCENRQVELKQTINQFEILYA